MTTPPSSETTGAARAAGPALRVVVVNGSPSRPSRTMGLVRVILDRLVELLPVETSQIDVYHLGPAFTGTIERDEAPEEVHAKLRLAEEADLLIAAVPVYRGSYPGMFKHFFDLIDQYALANKPVLLAATGGGDHHALALEHALRPLFGFFQALTIPVAVFASAGDFDGSTLLNPRVHGRVEIALADVADLLRTRATGYRTRTRRAEVGSPAPASSGSSSP
ncbi:NAD(P)H-dependent oxidoreductase [Streptomyces sp. NPDC059906]|uniref:NAD(P)H-dependent oxidoreductase n=1 Tax=Streptomyces sp. NPDC059906 TaxID=3346997 RepID=UPI00364E1608